MFRHGGFYYYEGAELKVAMLVEVYKSQHGTVHAVVEISTEDTEDPFLREAGIKIWKRRNTYSLISNLRNIWSVPLLHACFLEDQPCGFVTGPVDVREERSNVEQVKTVYNCLGRRGLYFLVNATAFSVPTGVGLGCC